MSTGWGIVIAAVLLVGVCCIGYFAVRSKVRGFSKEVFGTENIAEGFKCQEEEYSNVPKTVAAMTDLCLPRIARDFPEFSFAEFRQLAENLLRSILLSITAGSLSGLEEANDALREQVRIMLEADALQGNHRHYEKIRIHRTGINSYEKRDGVCKVVLQSAVGYIFYVTDDEGNVKSGSKTAMKQTRYNMELIYVQDYEKALSKYDGAGFAVSCPNCGAPVRMLGNKFCEYCGAGIEEISRKAWRIHSFKEL